MDELKGGAVVLLVCAVLLPFYTWWVEGQRDKEWVAKISAANGRVTRVLTDADIELEELDRKTLEKLDAEMRERYDELAELKRRRAIPLSDACSQCRVPAERLRLRE